MNILCPECNGLGMIHIAATAQHQRYDLVCPSCEGAGVFPDPKEFPNHCPACGEPLPKEQVWCDRHREAGAIEALMKLEMERMRGNQE